MRTLKQPAAIDRGACRNPGCGERVFARRPHAKYCSAKCRMAHAKERGPATMVLVDDRLDRFVRELVRVSEDPMLPVTLPDALRRAAIVAQVFVPEEVR